MDRGIRSENRIDQFIFDGEAVIPGVDGVSDFDQMLGSFGTSAVVAHGRDKKTLNRCRQALSHFVLGA
jgi:hypothetical protein